MTNDDKPYRKKDGEDTTSDPETIAASDGFVILPNVIAGAAKLLKLLKDRLLSDDRTVLELELKQSSDLENGQDSTSDPETVAASDGFVVLPNVIGGAGERLKLLKDRLLPDDRTVLELKLEQSSDLEIARSLGKPVDWVQKRKAHIAAVYELLKSCCD